MEYIIRRTSDHLEHHGILGQKWGIRRFQNPDGSLTAEGKKRYLSDRQIKSINDTVNKAAYNKDVSDKVFKIAGANKQALKDAKEELINAQRYKKEFAEKTDKLLNELTDGHGHYSSEGYYYEAVSEIANDIAYFGNNLTLEDVGNSAYQAIYNDGQQGMINAYSMYTYDKHLTSDIRKLNDDFNKAYYNSITVAKSYINTALEEVGGEALSTKPGTFTYTIGGKLVNRIMNSKDDSELSIGRMLRANHASVFDSKQKSAIALAKDIAKNVHNSSDSKTWLYFNLAIENLGLSSQKASGLSQSDWNKINKEIAKIRDNGSYGDDDEPAGFD